MAKPHYRWGYGFKVWYFVDGPWGRLLYDDLKRKYNYPLWLK